MSFQPITTVSTYVYPGAEQFIEEIAKKAESQESKGQSGSALSNPQGNLSSSGAHLKTSALSGNEYATRPFHPISLPFPLNNNNNNHFPQEDLNNNNTKKDSSKSSSNELPRVTLLTIPQGMLFTDQFFTYRQTPHGHMIVARRTGAHYTYMPPKKGPTGPLFN